MVMRQLWVVIVSSDPWSTELAHVQHVHVAIVEVLARHRPDEARGCERGNERDGHGQRRRRRIVKNEPTREHHRRDIGR